MKKNNEIRIAGFGGQGIIKAGYIIGKAASIFDDKHSTLIQSFGPEARGSSCSAQVLISESQILFPYIVQPDIGIMLSHDAYSTFNKEVAKGGTLLVEEDLVQPKSKPDKVNYYAIPATKLAEEMGRKIVMNIIIVGFFASITKVVSEESARKAVESSVPDGTQEMNLKAFETGCVYGQNLLAGKLN